MKIFYGSPAAGGIAWGPIHMMHREGSMMTTGKQTAGTPAEEMERLEAALQKADSELILLKERAVNSAGTEAAEIFEIHRMMLQDEDFTSRITPWILEKGMAAEAAVHQAGEELARIFSEMASSYLRARAADVRAVAKRLGDLLRGADFADVSPNVPSVLLADDLTPSETVCLDKSKVLAIVTQYGSANSHTAILARSMGIPAIVGMAAAWTEDPMEGIECIVDGGSGTMIIAPDEATMAKYQWKLAAKNKEKQTAEAMRGVRLHDEGHMIQICCNVGDIADIDTALANDAEGIGLFRSEFLFMKYGRAPTEEEQFEAYRLAVMKMDGRGCVIRTLDVGADKRIPYLNTPEEANPALGMRAVRLSLRDPELLYTQFRALYRAAAFGSLSAMVPMVVLPDELKRVRAIALDAERALLREHITVGHLPIGMMIETPAAALCADRFIGLAEFFSIGTNDLIQYTLAADRENRSVAYLADPLPESVVRLIRMACDGARAGEIPIGVCGELAADERYIGLLLDCGVTKLSVSPPSVLRVRKEASLWLKSKQPHGMA